MENYEEKKNGTASTVVSYLIVIVMTILIGYNICENHDSKTNFDATDIARR